MCAHNLCFEEKYQSISTENLQFLQFLKICLLHGHVFVMNKVCVYKDTLSSVLGVSIECPWCLQDQRQKYT